jgi:hypothetical protein
MFVEEPKFNSLPMKLFAKKQITTNPRRGQNTRKGAAIRTGTTHHHVMIN